MTVIEPETRLRAARGIAKTETEASKQALATLKQRGHPETPPPLVSDGLGGHREALVEVYGQVPAYSGRGRPPSRKQPQDDWIYLQMVKQRVNGRVVGVTPRVVYGEATTVRETLGKNTAYVERSHLTSRHMNARLVRKSLGFSKAREMFEASCAWEDIIYNLARPLKTLRVEVNDGMRRWQPRTPMMAAGLTDHIWSLAELLTRLPLPRLNNA